MLALLLLQWYYSGFLRPAFIGVFSANYKLKVCTITEAVGGDYLSLQLEDRDTCSIEGDPGRLLLRLESKENGGRHCGRGSEIRVRSVPL